MAIAIYKPKGMFPIQYTGKTDELRDMHLPVAGKDAWGMDTLIRTVRGSIIAAEKLRKELRQGQTFEGFYLQTWRPISHAYFPGFTLEYKGLLNGIPEPDIDNDVSQQTATITTNTPEKATREIRFYAPTTTYKYIQRGKPKGARYSSIDAGALVEPRIISSVVIGENGQRITGNVDIALLAALTVGAVNEVIAHRSHKIYGTPWFECEDVVCRKFPST